jgi:spore maturation protein CgeB
VNFFYKDGGVQRAVGSGAVRFAIFGLTISSAWANGHATPWRGLLKALHAAGHHATFFERDVTYYAAHRDLPRPAFCDLVLFASWPDVLDRATAVLREADVAIVTSYCPDGLTACQLVLDTPRPLHVFYDLDTPITVAALTAHGVAIPTGARYLTPELIPEFDLYLSFTGGPLLDRLQTDWGARRVAALYGSVDPSVHAPVVDPPEIFRCVLGYLGTYAADRQPSVDRLLLEPARRRPADSFWVVGSLYPDSLHWPPNVTTRWHLDPLDHPAFYSANRITLNVTRQAMRQWGFTPSGRIFEAAACGTPLLTDRWPGLETFFQPDAEVLVADSADDVQAMLDLDGAELARIGRAARDRVLSAHTGAVRAQELVNVCAAATC